MPAKQKQASITGASILFVLVPVLAARVADNKQEKAEAWANALRAAPAEAGCRQNPYQSRPEAVLAGRKLFRRHCDECHGPEAEGTTSAPSLRSRAVQEAAPGALHWFLTNGNLRHGMPSWAGLPSQQRWQIVSYLKSLGVSTDPGKPSSDPNSHADSASQHPFDSAP